MSETTTNRLRILRRGQADEARPAIPAMPAVRPPEAEPNELWTDEDLLNCCESSVDRGEKDEVDAALLINRSIRQRFRGCHAASILRKRYKEKREWCGAQGTRKLPRTTLWEMAEIYDRAMAAGHTEDDVAQHENWTRVKIAYGVAKERAKKQDEPAAAVAVRQEDPVEAEEVKETASAAPNDKPATGTEAAAAAPGDKPAEAAEPVAAVPDIGDEAGPSDGNGQASSSDAPAQASQGGCAPGGAGVKAAGKAAKAKKEDKKEQPELTSCEIDAGNNLLKVAGSWDRAMFVLESLKNIAGGQP